jgi:predicted amidohydrolase YtcJ
MGTADQLDQDGIIGSIKAVKYADLIVLDEDLFQIPAGQISETRVPLTLLGGNVVWQDPVDPL